MQTKLLIKKIPVQAILLIVAIACFSVSSVQGETIYGIGGTGESATSPVLFTFDSSTPGTTNTIGAITGITAGQTLEGIAFAPNGTLYALGYAEGSGATQGNSQLYTINLATGAASAVNAAPVNLGYSQGGASALSFGLAFVSSNAIQVIDGGGNIFQLNSTNGSIVSGSVGGVDYSTNPAAGNVPQWSDISFNLGGMLYTIDETNNQLGLRQTADPTKVDPIGNGLGISLLGPGTIGFEISMVNGIAYLQTDTSDAGVADELYTVNLTTGVATLVNQIGNNSNFNTIDIATLSVPEPATWAGMVLGGAMLCAYTRLRKRTN